jgi:hypothetical protein
MQLFNNCWLYASGDANATYEFDLDPTQSYWITGGLTQTQNNGAHLYVVGYCTISGDEQLCPLLGNYPDDSGLILQTFLGPGSTSVVVALQTTGGGDHFGEVSVYTLP